jgi:hypothetical protein
MATKKMTEAKDEKMDKKAGVKEGSRRDTAMDKKAGIKEPAAPKRKGY